MFGRRLLLQTIGPAIGMSLFALAAIASTSDSENHGGDVVAVGPLEIVEPTGVTVLGREFHIADSYGLEAGAKVAVHGELQSDGTVLNAWVEPVGDYTPGSDVVFEIGVVTKVNESLGEMVLGGSSMDYTASLANAGAATPSVGQTVSVFGTQPVAGGTVLVTTANAISGAAAVAASGQMGMRIAARSGAGARAFAQSGGGVQSQAQSGGGAQSQAQSGGGVQSQAQSGGGVGTN